MLENLSTDQFYAYRLCWCVILGDVDRDMELFEVGPLHHAQWLTLACWILRLYVYEVKPSKNLAIIAAFYINVYFPSWFETKLHHSILEGSRNYHAVLDHVMKLTDGAARSTTLKTLEQNSYFAHPQNVPLSMMSDENYHVRCIAVNKILAIRGVQEVGPVVLPADVFEGGDQCNDHEESHSMATMQAEVSNVRGFRRPKINNKAKVYYKMVNMIWAKIKEPPQLNIFVIKIWQRFGKLF